MYWILLCQKNLENHLIFGLLKSSFPLKQRETNEIVYEIEHVTEDT